MNKQTRKALIQSLSTDFSNARTADDYVRLATTMADAASQGRSPVWKGAARNAGEVILDHANRGLVTVKTTREAVRQGLDLMSQSNK